MRNYFAKRVANEILSLIFKAELERQPAANLSSFWLSVLGSCRISIAGNVSARVASSGVDESINSRVIYR